MLQALKATGSPLKVDDHAKARLIIGVSDYAPTVRGETFPVKAFLRREGGLWDSKVKSWIFSQHTPAQLRQALSSCADVGKVEMQRASPSPRCSLVVLEAPELGAAKAASLDAPLGKDHSQVPLRMRLRGKQQPGNNKLAVQSKKAQRQPRACRESHESETMRQKVHCSKTGKELQSTSVTRKRQCFETEDHVVETRIMVVKRVRAKN